MAFQLVSFGTPVIAQWTGIRLLPRVEPQVFFQATGVIGFVLADVTSVRLFPSVDPRVLLKIPLNSTGVVTKTATDSPRVAAAVIIARW